MDGEASVRHDAGRTPEEERTRDRSAAGGLRHDAAGDRHEGGGEGVKTQRDVFYFFIVDPGRMVSLTAFIQGVFKS